MEMPNVLDTKGLEQLANSIWDGELPLVTSTKKVSLDSFLEESSLPTVCASNESAKDWLLCKWPVVAALVQRLMPCDPGVAATLQVVTSKVRDDGTLAAAQLGCQKVVVPFLLQLNENWSAFQRGRVYVTVAQTWRMVSEKPSVEKYLKDGGRGSRQAAAVEQGLADLKAEVARLASKQGGQTRQVEAQEGHSPGEAETTPVRSKAEKKKAKDARRAERKKAEAEATAKEEADKAAAKEKAEKAKAAAAKVAADKAKADAAEKTSAAQK